MSERIYKGHRYNLAAPGANTNILAANATPETPGSSAFRVTVALAVASVFNVRVTDGTDAFTWGLNESVALNAGDLYTFTFGVQKGLSYNFQVETDGIIQFLLCEEITGGVL